MVSVVNHSNNQDKMYDWELGNIQNFYPCLEYNFKILCNFAGRNLILGRQNNNGKCKNYKLWLKRLAATWERILHDPNKPFPALQVKQSERHGGVSTRHMVSFRHLTNSSFHSNCKQVFIIVYVPISPTQRKKSYHFQSKN